MPSSPFEPPAHFLQVDDQAQSRSRSHSRPRRSSHLRRSSRARRSDSHSRPRHSRTSSPIRRGRQRPPIRTIGSNGGLSVVPVDLDEDSLDALEQEARSLCIASSMPGLMIEASSVDQAAVVLLGVLARIANLPGYPILEGVRLHPAEASDLNAGLFNVVMFISPRLSFVTI